MGVKVGFDRTLLEKVVALEPPKMVGFGELHP
jgi:hypothetical protein